MAHVLGVTAFEIGDPMPLFVLMESDDATRDGRLITQHCALPSRARELHSTCPRREIFWLRPGDSSMG